jgi:polar amino acid transport system substrate-binding protein
VARRLQKKKVLTRALSLVLASALCFLSLGFFGCDEVPEPEITPIKPKVDPPAIQTEGILRVGVDSGRAPYAGLSKGNLVGIDVDIAAALTDKLGLKLELVDLADKRAQDLLDAGEIDMIMDVEESGVRLDRGIEIGPYLESGPAIFALIEGNTPPELDLDLLTGAKVAAQKDSLSAWAVQTTLGEQAVIETERIEDAFGLVENETAAYAAADAVAGSYLASNYAAVSCAMLFPDKKIGVYLGVASENEALADALTEALINIRDDSTLSVILAKWLGSVSSGVVASSVAIIAQSVELGLSPQDHMADDVDTGDDLPDPANAGEPDDNN